MASCGIVLGYRAENGVSAMRSSGAQSEEITTSAASEKSLLIADDSNQYWEISPAADAWVAFGVNPTAAAGTTFKIWAGTTRHFKATPGDTVAVVDA